ncbi:BsuBI/PstI family type II restriction endonuclease [Paenibacillus rigui]|uniref:Restriction endonuclease n=1 Tax=Paenibacillus rigui TaxID=554312 RepID=A0A229ULB2_9BACL|nr:BsuBI/PstI family type II restriction endonuclease [Paenibacillus rigui]OXM83699.1 restriction endonuclease [Paenibacillus rigui]
MGKIEEAKDILMSLGMPKTQYNDRSAYTFLALASLMEHDDWVNASSHEKRISEIMEFTANYYGKLYKTGSREGFRKSTVHQFCDAAITVRNIVDTDRATNSPKYSYQLTDEILDLIKNYGTDAWEGLLAKYLEGKETLIQKYAQKREINRIPVVIDGEALHFSPGKHNKLQKAIIEEFAPRFAPGSKVLYVGDTAKKDLVKKGKKLKGLGVKLTDNDKLPDVILYRSDKDWLYFIEAVTSVGPVSVKRMNDIKNMLENCTSGIVYVTAFLDMSSKNGFKKFIDEIAWDTEIWIAENPDHMIHLNGDRFLGPR